MSIIERRLLGLSTARANGTYAPLASPTFSGTLSIATEAGPNVTPVIELDAFGRHFQGPMVDTSNAGGGRDLVIMDIYRFRRVGDFVTTNGSVNVSSAAQARFGLKDNGVAVTGTGIPNGTTLVWVSGTDSATSARLSQAATASGTITATIGTNDGATLDDAIYVNEGGGQGWAIGFGETPPTTSHRVTIRSDDSVPGQGGLKLRLGPSQTGDIETVIDSGGTVRAGLDSNMRRYGLVTRCTDRTTSGGQVIQGWTDETGGSQWSWSYAGSGSSTLRLKYATGGVTVMDVQTSGTLTIYKPIQTQSANESTGAGSAALGANCPATTLTAPYKWIKFTTSDSSTVWVPAWK